MITVKNLTKSYGSTVVLNDISISFEGGDIVAIFGESGSGKTTFLKVLAGLIEYDEGEILGNHDIGFVFQDFKLFPNMSAINNLLYAPIKVFGQNKAKAKDRAMDLLDAFNMQDHADKYPSQLSGGQKQRIAICRTMMLDIDAISLDEPTSALDAVMVSEVINIIKNVCADDKIIFIASHDIQFLRDTCNRIVCIEHGKIARNTSTVKNILR